MKLVPRETQTVVDPRTGVMFPVEEVKDDLLVEIFTELEAREKQFQEWRRMAEDELVRRRKACPTCRGKGTVVKDGPSEWEYDNKYPCPDCNPWPRVVTVESNASRVWDATELQLVVEDLAGRGLIRPEDADGLLTDQEPKVDGKKAVDLLNRSEGDALMELRRCFTWKQGRPRVKVTPTAHIEP